MNESFNKAWQEWLDYRKERRLPCYKPIGLKKTLKRLTELSGDNETEAIKIIEYSISQNYQGLFKEKNYGFTTNQTGNGSHTAGTSEKRIAALKEWGSTGV